MTTAYLQSAKRNEPQGLASGTRRILDTPWPAAGWTDDAGAKPLGAIRDPSLGKHNERHGKADHQDDSGTENEPPFMIRPNHKALIAQGRRLAPAPAETIERQTRRSVPLTRLPARYARLTTWRDPAVLRSGDATDCIALGLPWFRRLELRGRRAVGEKLPKGFVGGRARRDMHGDSERHQAQRGNPPPEFPDPCVGVWHGDAMHLNFGTSKENIMPSTDRPPIPMTPNMAAVMALATPLIH